MFFVFDGEQFCDAKTLGEAIKESNDAIDCYSDQCDPDWPEEVENICFGIILGHARQIEHQHEPGRDSTYSYVIDDHYTEAMKAAAEEDHPERYDYCELVSAIADRGITQLPGLLATVVDTCCRQPVFKDGEALLRFVSKILVRNGMLAEANNSLAVMPTAAERSLTELPRVTGNPDGYHAREVAIQRIAKSLDGRAGLEFDLISRKLLMMALEKCGLTDLPAVTGDPDGERASGSCICDTCKQPFLAHPLDWRVIGYGDVPFLNVLCDGRRVKL